jgi:NTE family protein
MTDTITLARQRVPLTGKPVVVNGRVVTPNGLADAVFEGGGAKGIGHIGALAYAEEIGVRWVNVAGTSAGAITAALVTAGYTATKIEAIMNEIDFRRFKDEDLVDKIPLLGKVISLVAEKGIYEGDYFEATMADYLARRQVRTFKDLVIPEYTGDAKYRYRLRVVASDVSRGKMLVLPEDIRDYGQEPENLSVARAIRMSMSIPFIFEPVKEKLPTTGDTCYIVDGGLLSNYPLHLFDKKGTPSWPTFGFNLREPSEARPIRTRIRGPVSLGLAIFNSMFSAMDRRYIEERNWDRTIGIPTLGVGTTDFVLSPARRRALYDSGYQAARRFFDDWWDWDRHVRARLAGKTMEQL